MILVAFFERKAYRFSLFHRVFILTIYNHLYGPSDLLNSALLTTFFLIRSEDMLGGKELISTLSVDDFDSKEDCQQYSNICLRFGNSSFCSRYSNIIILGNFTQLTLTST